MPGWCSTGCARNDRTHGSSGVNFGSVWWPVHIVSRSRTRIALSLSEGGAGASSGKNFSTGSSMPSFPSATARPTAVEVKLLLSEYRTCGWSAAAGCHQPSATPRPCRTSMKLCIASTPLSAASTNSRPPADETPCASGVLRGKSDAAMEGGAAARSRAARLARRVGRCMGRLSRELRHSASRGKAAGRSLRRARPSRQRVVGRCGALNRETNEGRPSEAGSLSSSRVRPLRRSAAFSTSPSPARRMSFTSPTPTCASTPAMAK